jgi:hypothetical protein
MKTTSIEIYMNNILNSFLDKFFSRYGLISFSFFILIFHLVIGRYIVEWVFMQYISYDLTELSAESSSLSLVAYGVILECRKTFKRWFINKYKPNHSDCEYLNAQCERYGILILIIGLLMEVVNELFHTKASEVYFQYLDPILVILNLILYISGAVAIGFFIYNLIRYRKNKEKF